MQIGEAHEQRRHAAKPWPPVAPLGELPHRTQARLLARLDERPRELDPALAPQSTAEAVDELARIDALVPHVEVADLREAAHRLAVLPDACGDEPTPAVLLQPDVTACDLDARGHPLDIPLPRPGQRLVEVVRSEDQPAVGSGEPAEVRDVSVAAGLYGDAGVGRRRQVRRHHGRGAAVKGERRDEHAPVPDRDQLLYARRRLGFEQRHRIRATGRRRPVAVRRPGHGLPRRPAALRRLPGLQHRDSDRRHARKRMRAAAPATASPPGRPSP